jgi:hypothetical protein
LSGAGAECGVQVEPSNDDGGALPARLARTEAEMAALEARHAALKREEAAAAAARRMSLEMEQCRRQEQAALAQRDLKAARQTQVTQAMATPVPARRCTADSRRSVCHSRRSVASSSQHVRVQALGLAVWGKGGARVVRW